MLPQAFKKISVAVKDLIQSKRDELPFADKPSTKTLPFHETSLGLVSRSPVEPRYVSLEFGKPLFERGQEFTTHLLRPAAQNPQ